MLGGVRGSSPLGPIQALQAGISSISSKLDTLASKINDVCISIFGSKTSKSNSSVEVVPTTSKAIGPSNQQHSQVTPQLGSPTHKTTGDQIKQTHVEAQSPTPPEPKASAPQAATTTPGMPQTYQQKIQSLVNQINTQGCAKFEDAQLERTLNLLRGISTRPSSNDKLEKLEYSANQMALLEGIDVPKAIATLENEKSQRAANKSKVSTEASNKQHTANLKILDNIVKFLGNNDNFNFHDGVSEERIKEALREGKGLLMQLKGLKGDISPQEMLMYEKNLRNVVQSALSTLEDRAASRLE